ncbi:MAG: outer membrane beta-barrel protein [Prevotella sp.]|nr:outer membrane beta-barrel protein [Prevotella sp.]
MKRLLSMMLLAITATANATDIADNDTLTINKPAKVRIITGDSIQKIKVYGREGDDKYTYESSIELVDSNYVSETNINKDNWTFDFVKRHSGNLGYPLEKKSISSRIGIGLCSAIEADEGISVSTGSSWEIFWTIAAYEYYAYGKKDGFSVGFGLDWRNYRMTGFNYFSKANEGTISVEKYPVGTEPDFSRIKVFSLQIPLMWQHRFNKRWSFALGPVINFNTYASIKNKYTDANGEKHKDVLKHIHQKPFTIDLMAELNILNEFSVYCKYSPMNILNSDYSNKGNFQSLSFGIYL